MSVNKYKPHILVLPEDDANRQIANGFMLALDPENQSNFNILKVAGGWNEVMTNFNNIHAADMEIYSERFMVLIIDLDSSIDRPGKMKGRILEHLRPRVFILGVLDNPERLRQDLGCSYETIGQKLAEDCRDETGNIWNHAQLRHNVEEISRLREQTRTFLFSA